MPRHTLLRVLLSWKRSFAPIPRPTALLGLFVCATVASACSGEVKPDQNPSMDSGLSPNPGETDSMVGQTDDTRSGIPTASGPADLQSTASPSGSNSVAQATTPTAGSPSSVAPTSTSTTSFVEPMTTSPAAPASAPTTSETATPSPSSSPSTLTTAPDTSATTTESASSDPIQTANDPLPTQSGGDPGDDAGPADGSTQSSSTSKFNIDLVFMDDQQGAGLSTAVRQAFTDAQQVWQQVIVGDLPDVTLSRMQPCFADTGAYVDGTVDDLRIFIMVAPIDGPDGILGAAAPCLARSSGGLPFAGYMEFDSADLDRFANQGRLDEVVIHEMGHVLGIGSIWQDFSLVADVSSGDEPNRDTHFTGSKAIAAFDEIGGQNYTGGKVPVENVGGEGTANGHWREDLLGNELMTSYMTNLEGVLSKVTIGSLEDLGYEVDYSAAGNYAWPPPGERSAGLSFLRADDSTEPVYLGNDIINAPIVYVDE